MNFIHARMNLLKCIRKKKIYFKLIDLPKTSEYWLGSLLRSTQCAAVKAQCWFSREAPQLWRPFTRRDNCHGQELGLACSPPTMRDPKGFLPHPVKQEHKSYIFQVINHWKIKLWKGVYTQSLAGFFFLWQSEAVVKNKVRPRILIESKIRFKYPASFYCIYVEAH